MTSDVTQAAARFWEKVDKSGGPDACWPWTAAPTRGDMARSGLVERCSVRTASPTPWRMAASPPGCKPITSAITTRASILTTFDWRLPNRTWRTDRGRTVALDGGLVGITQWCAPRGAPNPGTDIDRRLCTARPLRVPVWAFSEDT